MEAQKSMRVSPKGSSEGPQRGRPRWGWTRLEWVFEEAPCRLAELREGSFNSPPASRLIGGAATLRCRPGAREAVRKHTSTLSKRGKRQMTDSVGRAGGCPEDRKAPEGRGQGGRPSREAEPAPSGSGKTRAHSQEGGGAALGTRRRAPCTPASTQGTPADTGRAPCLPCWWAEEGHHRNRSRNLGVKQSPLACLCPHGRQASWECGISVPCTLLHSLLQGGALLRGVSGKHHRTSVEQGGQDGCISMAVWVRRSY